MYNSIPIGVPTLTTLEVMCGQLTVLHAALDSVG
jgi:hypothetical protein